MVAYFKMEPWKENGDLLQTNVCFNTFNKRFKLDIIIDSKHSWQKCIVYEVDENNNKISNILQEHVTSEMSCEDKLFFIALRRTAEFEIFNMTGCDIRIDLP